MSMNLNDIAILNIHRADYCYIISEISKSETINLMENVGLTEDIITVGDIEIEKQKIYRCKSPTFFRRCRY